MFELTGKRALVTGASGGIGGAIARGLAAQGASVALSGTRRDALDALAAEIGGSTQVVPCDLSDAEQVATLIERTEAALGELDILVNNAGLTKDNLFARVSDGDWEKVIAVNLTAAFKLSRDVLRGMVRRRSGRNITINCVAPGFIATAMTDALNEKQRAMILERVPAKRLGTPDDVASAVAFLASGGAAYITGQTIHVNGGMAMI